MNINNQRSKLTICLAVLLFLSNGFWLYLFIDQAITRSYQSESQRRRDNALAQLLAILPVANRINATSADIIRVARQTASFDFPPFEKDGLVWVGNLGLKFNKAGRLVEVQPY
ncbi:MAG: hypothetical protein J0H83_09195 [Candidatus Melainabacteria bacterium]|nr:hypothetical protein [Candidatus Melainabacteria bacterium]